MPATDRLARPRRRMVLGLRRPRGYHAAVGLGLAAVAAVSFGQAAPGTVRAASRVPPGFVGMVVDGPMVDGGMRPRTIDREFDQMVATGVETVRAVFYWDDVQPYPDFGHLPAASAGHYRNLGGIPTDLSRLDAMVRRAAQRHLKLLPVVLRAPGWARVNPYLPYSPPRDPKAYGNFVDLLVRRYGRGGSFWIANPKLPRLPVRAWQIWNEPAGGAFPHGPSVFWQDKQPFEGRYLELLRQARRRIKAFDPHAQVVLAGLFGASWDALAQIYKAGGRGLFDAVGVNIFTRLPSNVLVALGYVRRMMNRHGDRAMPIMVTELAWPTAKGRTRPSFDYDVTPRAQARKLRSAYGLLAADRVALHLTTVIWDDWVSRDELSYAQFDFAGLRRLKRNGQVVPKPGQAALRRFARRWEGCAKRGRADRCVSGRPR